MTRDRQTPISLPIPPSPSNIEGRVKLKKGAERAKPITKAIIWQKEKGGGEGVIETMPLRARHAKLTQSKSARSTENSALGGQQPAGD